MFKAIAMKLGLRWLGSFCREVADGKKGPGPQRLYVSLIGKKRVIGLLLALLTAGLIGAGQVAAAAFVTGPLAAIFVAAGFADDRWRQIPKLDSPWLRLARAHAFDIAAVFAIVSAALTTCQPRVAAYLAAVHLTCQGGSAILAGFSAVLAQLGINAEAQAATPPALGKTIKPTI